MIGAHGRDVLVVAGEASGDRIAAKLARTLGSSASLFGVAGAAARRAGVVTEAGPDLGVVGVGGLHGIAWPLARALGGLFREVRRRRPRAAVLVNYTELNGRLGRWLRARGVFVLWCVAPQVWAWRPGRTSTLLGAMDRLAVILPFEERLWRRAGADAHYVGHPSLEPAVDRAMARAALALSEGPALAVLPGSRAGEVARLAEPLCEAARRLRADGSIRHAMVIRAPALPPDAARTLDAAAARAGLPVVALRPEEGAGRTLAAFDAALVASGTASLEAALAGAAPIVAYRTDPITYAAASRLVRTPHVALPNVLLGRRVFPELLQAEATPARLADAGRFWISATGRARAAAAAAELRRLLQPPDGPASFGERLARLLPL